MRAVHGSGLPSTEIQAAVDERGRMRFAMTGINSRCAIFASWRACKLIHKSGEVLK
jgi:hypothetical protein